MSPAYWVCRCRKRNCLELKLCAACGHRRLPETPEGMTDPVPSKECKCTLRQSLLGDGCEVCNPTLALEYAKERIADLEREVALMRACLSSVQGCATCEACRGAATLALGSNTEGEIGRRADVGPGGGASASASGETHAPELSAAIDEVMAACPSQPPGDGQ